ncbi:MAG: hypothetical protein JWN46_476 [Acidimicrobiales bacterium]|nr:hypothetical protein [Acidimicrobiales bacterium]
MSVAVPIAFTLFFVVFFGMAVVSMVFWFLALIEVIKLPDHQFRAAGTEKTTWILAVALAGIVGALIWRFLKRQEVLAAAGWLPIAPPGWYPDPVTGSPCWWDGVAWRRPSTPAPPSG